MIVTVKEGDMKRKSGVDGVGFEGESTYESKSLREGSVLRRFKEILGSQRWRMF